MIALIIALASVAAYFSAGWLIAVRRMPRAWENARREWTNEASSRASVKGQAIGMIAGWPLYGAILLISHGLGAAAGRGDPKAAAEREAALQTRISDLESENRRLARDMGEAS